VPLSGLAERLAYNVRVGDGISVVGNGVPFKTFNRRERGVGRQRDPWDDRKRAVTSRLSCGEGLVLINLNPMAGEGDRSGQGG